MTGRGVARRYARALYELAAEGGAAVRVEEELSGVAERLRQQPDFARLLASPLVPVEEKKAALRAALAGVVSPLVLDFLLLLVEKQRERVLPAVAQELRRLVMAAERVADAELVLAAPLAQPELDRMAAQLEQATGRRVRLTSRVDPALIGGMVLRIGDRKIDGSLRGRLTRLRAFLAAAPATPGGDDGRQPGR